MMGNIQLNVQMVTYRVLHFSGLGLGAHALADIALEVFVQD